MNNKRAILAGNASNNDLRVSATLEIAYRYCFISIIFIGFLLLTANHFPPGAVPVDYDTVDTGPAIRDANVMSSTLAKEHHPNQQQLDTTNSDYTNLVSPKQSRPSNKKKNEPKKKARKNKSTNLNELSSQYAKSDLFLGSAPSLDSAQNNQSKDNFIDLQRMIELVRLEHAANLSSVSERPVMSLGQLNNIDLG